MTRPALISRSGTPQAIATSCAESFARVAHHNMWHVFVVVFIGAHNDSVQKQAVSVVLSKEEFCPANDNQGISRDAAAVSLQGMVRFGNRQFCRVVEKCHTVVSSSAFFCCSEGVGLSLSLALPVRDIRTKVIFISEIAPSSHCDHLFRIGFSVGWFL